MSVLHAGREPGDRRTARRAHGARDVDRQVGARCRPLDLVVLDRQDLQDEREVLIGIARGVAAPDVLAALDVIGLDRKSVV